MISHKTEMTTYCGLDFGDKPLKYNELRESVAEIYQNIVVKIMKITFVMKILKVT